MEPDRLLLLSCLDLTALGDEDDEATIEALCGRAARPVANDETVRVAAVCVWPRFVPLARQRLAGTGVRVASAIGFPDARGDLAGRLDEVREAVLAGAEEVDVVVDRRLADDPAALGRDLRATRAAAGAATWKAILETGVLTPAELITIAAAAIDAGGDFLKTSTGKGPPGATAEAVAAIASIVASSGRPVGIKVSGGVRAAAEARAFLEIVRGRLGPGWVRPERFRIGASSLLDALVAP